MIKFTIVRKHDNFFTIAMTKIYFFFIIYNEKHIYMYIYIYMCVFNKYIYIYTHIYIYMFNKYIYIFVKSSLVAQMVNCLSAMRETWVWSLGREDTLEKEMATQSSTIAWKIPWTEKPDRLQSMGSQRVGHDWATSLYLLKNYMDMIKIRHSESAVHF